MSFQRDRNSMVRSKDDITISIANDHERKSLRKKQTHYFLDAKTKAPVSNEKRFVFLWEEDF